ncbi:MAG TPA: 3-keto-5-aminohexanoate cleavage protein [Kiritimatiellia bacterium]|nr:3-keto-5-aminohexanoate cleavage protein [Kiritimatiellia bacterium]HMP34784.1 3-keto-5-aminohexanoate cleavage protein [Kiritimatiellia bacterium]
MRKFLLNFTPNGMIPSREMNPHVPITPDEILRDVRDAVALGANMVHVHARDPETGHPTHRKEVYGSIIRSIRSAFPDLVIGVSTSGRHWPEFEKRAEVLNLEGIEKPDMASLTLGSLNFNTGASVNSPDMIQSLARRMHERGITPELEVFDAGMINYAKYLERKGILKPPFYFNLILGNIACAQADPLHLGVMIRDLPSGSLWSAGGVGRAQLPMNVMALASGGGVRIGLEDNLWIDDARSQPASNRELLVRILEIASRMGLAPCTHREARALLGLPS